MNKDAVRVLLVEDEADHIELIRRGFDEHQGHAFDLQVAGTLAEARSILATSIPDMMIIDNRLPDGEGAELLPGKLEERKLPIIMLTGHGDQDVAVKALKSGAMDYIVKSPASMADLVTSCERTMQEWRYICERRVTLSELSTREALIKKMFQTAPTGLLMLVGERITFVNEHLCTMLGYQASELIGKEERMLFCHDQEFERCVRLVEDHIAKTGMGSIETRFITKDGGIIDVWLGAAPVDVEDMTAGLTFTALDITARKKAEAEMRFMASHDGLTGLANRSLFMDRLASAMAMARRQKSGLALMFIDLDDFKAINDSLGHEVGDIVLQQFSTRVMGCLRESDSIARFGGDEFLVLLPMTISREAASGVAEKINALMMGEFEINGHDVKLGCSIGIAMFPEQGNQAEDLINLADEAMYEAKQSTRNGFRFAH